jgi:hypothetical protein
MKEITLMSWNNNEFNKVDRLLMIIGMINNHNVVCLQKSYKYHYY